MGIKRTLTAYFPWNDDNLYCANVRSAIEEAGYDVMSLRSLFKNPIKFMRCKIVNLNWFDNAPTRKSYLKKSLVLLILKIFRKRIIYTLHNVQPHDLKNNRYAIKMMKKLCDQAAAIVGLCPDTHDVVKRIAPDADAKVSVIPHPNYIANYSLKETQGLREKFGFAKEDLVLLYMGLLRPYKNIELLIDVFRRIQEKNIKLLIAGNASDGTYREKLLQRAAGDPNIIFDFRYIPDDEVPAYYKTADLVVLPYHKVSSLNSGVVYLSFSLKKTVVCPDIGTINMIPDKSFVYAYHYETEEEHGAKLAGAIQAAVADFERDPAVLQAKGEAAYLYVEREHAEELIAEKYKNLYGKVRKA